MGGVRTPATILAGLDSEGESEEPGILSIGSRVIDSFLKNLEKFQHLCGRHYRVAIVKHILHHFIIC